MTPFLVEAGGQSLRSLSRTEAAPVGQEPHVWLRELIHRCPALLPLDELAAGLGPLVPIACGLDTGSGVLDNLLVSTSGQLVLVMIDAPGPQRANQPVDALIQHGRQIARWSSEKFREVAGFVGAPTEDSPGALALLNTALERCGVPRAQFEDGLAQCLAQADFLVLIVGQQISPEICQRMHEVQAKWGLRLQMAAIEMPFYHSADGRLPGQITIPRVVADEEQIRRLNTSLDAALLLMERQRQRAGAPWMPPPAMQEWIPLTTFHELKTCREFHDRLRAARLLWRTNVSRDEAKVYVYEPHERQARQLLRQQPPDGDQRHTGFQITFDYPIFGALIAGAFGMILMAVEFRHPRDLIRPLLLVALGGIVGWVAERARISRRATGSLQLSPGDLVVAGAAMTIAAITFLSGLAR